MAAKSANLYARIEPDVKEQAEPNLQDRRLLIYFQRNFVQKSGKKLVGQGKNGIEDGTATIYFCECRCRKTIFQNRLTIFRNVVLYY